jgi:glutaredoxin 3
MAAKRKIEVFTAGCSMCDETVAMVKRVSCSSCDVEIHDVREAGVAAKAKQYGVVRVPAVVINGRLADCCAGNGPNEQTLRAAGLGQA